MGGGPLAAAALAALRRRVRRLRLRAAVFLWMVCFGGDFVEADDGVAQLDFGLGQVVAGEGGHVGLGLILEEFLAGAVAARRLMF